MQRDKNFTNELTTEEWQKKFSYLIFGCTEKGVKMRCFPFVFLSRAFSLLSLNDHVAS